MSKFVGQIVSPAPPSISSNIPDDDGNLKKIVLVSESVQTDVSAYKSLEYIVTVPFDWNSVGRLNWNNLYNKVLTDIFEVYRLCFTVKLLPKSLKCDGCGAQCRLCPHFYQGSRNPRINFSCRNCKHYKYDRKYSMLKGTIFENAKISIGKILGMAYWFVYGSDSGEEAVRECVFEDPIGANTVIIYYNLFREICCQKARDDTYIGGPGCIVEVNEYLKSKSFAEKEKESTAAIIIGMCRESGEMFVIENKDKTAKNFLKIIIQYVQPHTTVVTNCEMLCDNLTDQEWEDITADTHLTFREAMPGSDYLNVCGVWSDVKGFLQSKPFKKLDAMLGLYMWRRKYSRKNFNLYKSLLQHFAEFPNSGQTFRVKQETELKSQ